MNTHVFNVLSIIHLFSNVTNSLLCCLLLNSRPCKENLTLIIQTSQCTSHKVAFFSSAGSEYDSASRKQMVEIFGTYESVGSVADRD